jgi:hypothetical protein
MRDSKFGQQVTGMYAELGREKTSAEYQGAAETSLPTNVTNLVFA